LVDCDGAFGAAALGIAIVETRITTKLGPSLMRKAKVGELSLAMGWGAQVAVVLASCPGPELQSLLSLPSPKKFGTHHALMLAAHLHPSLACAYEASALGSSATPLPTSGGERYNDDISTLSHVPSRRKPGDNFVTEGRLVITVDGSTIEILPGAAAVVVSGQDGLPSQLVDIDGDFAVSTLACSECLMAVYILAIGRVHQKLTRVKQP
jgi:hypothetical protein